MGESNNTKLTPKVWTAFVLFGLIGQIVDNRKHVPQCLCIQDSDL